MLKKLDYITFYGILFQSVRMITGAFLVVYMINKGLSLFEIAILKAIQAAIILFSDIPLSYIADKFSRKFSICLSAIFATMWLYVMIFAETFFSFAIAEILNSISISLMGGAFISYLIDQQGLKEKETIKDKISHYHQYQFFLMGVAAFFGAAFAEVDSSTLLIVSAILMLLVFLMSLYLPSDNRSSARKKRVRYLFKENIVKIFDNIKKDFLTLQALLAKKANVKQVMLVLVASMFTYQIIIQYWQPFSFSGYSSLPKQGIFYGSIFAIILFIQSLAAFLAKKMNNKKVRVVGNIIVTLSVFFNIIGIYFLKELLFLGVVLVFMGNRMIILSLQASFHSLIESNLRSTFESFISTLTRVLLLIIFPILGALLQYYGWVILISLFIINSLLVYKIIIED